MEELRNQYMYQTYSKWDYTEEEIPMLKTRMEMTFEPIQIKNILVPPAYVLTINDNKYLAFHITKNEISLAELLYEYPNLSIPQLVKIILKIGGLIQEINKVGYIVGSIDLEDFWMIDGDINSLFIRQRKALFKTDTQELKGYSASQISGLDVRKKRFERVHMSWDVELLGRLFMKLVIPERNIRDYKELRYLAYNIGLFRKDMSIEMYGWIDKVTTQYKENQYETVAEAIKALQQIIHTVNENKKADSNIENKYFYNFITHTGQGKIAKLSKEQIQSIDHINQDSIWIYEENNRLFGFVADGVSNCSYGTGYRAANILKEVCQREVINGLNIKDETDLFNLYSKIVNGANEEICHQMSKEILEEDERNIEDIMSTTFVSCLLLDGIAYIVSIGDSRAFIYRNKQVVPLTVEDNFGNRCIVQGKTWDEYNEIDKKSALMEYVGRVNGITKLPEQITFTIRKIKLQKEDVIILSSDGLTDYMASATSKDVWDMSHQIGEIIDKHWDKGLAYINTRLVRRANFHGGRDNISSILIHIT